MIREIEILNKLDRRHFKYNDSVAEMIRQVCELYLKSDAAHRQEIRESFTADFALFWFAKDMAVRAVRENEVDRVRKGLIAVLIEGARRDVRDTLFPIALLYNSASKIGADPHKLFNWAASISNEKMKSILDEFLSRPASLREINKFGFREAQTETGFDYASS
ncbi:MAG TPA: hypothetical protein VFP59_05555 [Candidatus Angelobacter sp.]|nr:hypothetical protein [Candidatus Angelobacter sp.]